MSKVLVDYEDYLNRRVKIINSSKPFYRRLKIIRAEGIVTKVCSNDVIGVKLDDYNNPSSVNGLFWFTVSDLKVLDLDKEGDVIIMNKDFKEVALIDIDIRGRKGKLPCAIYEEESKLLRGNKENPDLVVVEIVENGVLKRKVGEVRDLISVESYESSDKVCHEIIGVVNKDASEAREAERERLKQIEERKRAIEHELNKEIHKRRNMEYYQEMAEKYSDNPRLMELVEEMKKLIGSN